MVKEEVAAIPSVQGNAGEATGSSTPQPELPASGYNTAAGSPPDQRWVVILASVLAATSPFIPIFQAWFPSLGVKSMRFPKSLN